MKKIYYILSLFIFSTILFSCNDELSIGSTVDENNYNNIGKTEAFLKDGKSGSTNNIIELRTKGYSSSINVVLSKQLSQGIDFNIAFDENCLEDYNSKHNTDLKLFPKELVTIGGNGEVNIMMAPNETSSFNIDLHLKPNSEKLENDATYLLPLKISSKSDKVTISEQGEHCYYIVKNYTYESDCDKGPDAVKNFLYYECNDTNPLNTLEFVREDGKLFFDFVVLFAANINWDAEKGRVYLYCNPNIQFLLDNNETFLQPLRKRGIKVILSILGNHDQAGLCQLSEMGAKEFAKEMAAFCNTYNLDGVNFDDEYSGDPDLNNPWLTYWCEEAGSRLIYETKMQMPDKYVTVYYLGRMHSSLPDVNGMEIGNFVDIAVADYENTTSPMRGMGIDKCAAMSVELRQARGSIDSNFARQKKEEGYGYYMWFALYPPYYCDQVWRINEVCKGLYEQELKEPQYYYKKDDLTKYPASELPEEIP